MSRKWFGHPGHFVGSAYCRFHLHTHVDGFCISTVGDYQPRHSTSGKPEQIGSGRTYETMVFRLQPDGEHDGMDIDFAGYSDRDAANAGHAKFILYVEGGRIGDAL